MGKGIYCVHDLWEGREAILQWSEMGPDGFVKEIPIGNLFFSIQKQRLRERTGPADRKGT